MVQLRIDNRPMEYESKPCGVLKFKDGTEASDIKCIAEKSLNKLVTFLGSDRWAVLTRSTSDFTFYDFLSDATTTLTGESDTVYLLYKEFTTYGLFIYHARMRCYSNSSTSSFYYGYGEGIFGCLINLKTGEPLMKPIILGLTNADMVRTGSDNVVFRFAVCKISDMLISLGCEAWYYGSFLGVSQGFDYTTYVNSVVFCEMFDVFTKEQEHCIFSAGLSSGSSSTYGNFTTDYSGRSGYTYHQTPTIDYTKTAWLYSLTQNKLYDGLSNSYLTDNTHRLGASSPTTSVGYNDIYLVPFCVWDESTILCSYGDMSIGLSRGYYQKDDSTTGWKDITTNIPFIDKLSDIEYTHFYGYVTMVWYRCDALEFNEVDKDKDG